jgi:hypothetical protein
MEVDVSGFDSPCALQCERTRKPAKGFRSVRLLYALHEQSQ